MTPDNVHHKARRNGHNQTDMSYYSEPTTPPRTPQRVHNNHQQRQGARSTNNQHDGSSARPKSKGKSRQQQQPNQHRASMTSPAIRKSERSNSQTVPSKTSRPLSTPSSAAFAGSTFHASPAPSTLPLPSFMKDLSDSPSVNSLKAAKDETDSTSDDSLTPPLPRAVVSESQREESPLDLLFNADRAEKARTQSTSSNVNPFNLPRPQSHQTPGSAHQSRMTPASHGVMFDMELHESTTEQYESPYSTNFAQRIQAARSNFPGSASPTTSQNSPLSKSDALKAYLFSGMGKAQQSSDADNVFGSQPSTAPNTPGNGNSNGTTPYHYNGSQSAGHAARPPFNALKSDHSATNSPRVRASGLRQEFKAPTTPSRTPDHRDIYSASPSSPSPFRVYHNAPFPARENMNAQSNFQNQAAPYSASPDARGSDLRLMEDQIRRMLKLEDAGVAAAGAGTHASHPVPSQVYTNERGPPLQGFQNGVMGSY